MAQVDTYGTFPFVLLKVTDRSGVNKLLVRGKTAFVVAQLLQVHRLRPSARPPPPGTFS